MLVKGVVLSKVSEPPISIWWYWLASGKLIVPDALDLTKKPCPGAMIKFALPESFISLTLSS